MKFPEAVKVGPYTYAVKFVENLRAKEDNRSLYGYWQSSPPEIQILAGEMLPRTTAILLHEAIHVIDEYMVIGLSEKQTTRLAAGLTAFLQDNSLLAEIEAVE